MRQASPWMRRGFAYVAGHTLAPVLPLTGRTTFLRHPIACLLPTQAPRSAASLTSEINGFRRLVSLGSAWAFLRGYGNINPLSIDYACRPRLRSRLTLGGLAWPRNPWSFGGQGSHLPYRYSCRHSHSCGVHGSVTRPLRSPHDAPLPIPQRGIPQLRYCA